MSDGLISYKVVIPQHLYDQIIDTMHATTLKHVGVTKTIAYLKGQVIMPGLTKWCVTKLHNAANAQRKKLARRT